MRHFLRQGWGTQGWANPARISAIQEYMKNCTQTLEQERLKWFLEEEKLEQQQALRKKLSDAALAKLAKNQSASLQAAAEAQALAAAAMLEGASELRVSAPDDFAVPKAKAKGKAKAKDKAKAETAADLKSVAENPETAAELKSVAEKPETAAELKAAGEKPASSVFQDDLLLSCLLMKPETAAEPEPAAEKPEAAAELELAGEKPEAAAELEPAVEKPEAAAGSESTEELQALSKRLENWQGSLKWSPQEVKYYLKLCEGLPQPRITALSNVVIFGLGTCAKCRWVSGCYMCDPEKAIRYHLSQEGLVPKAKKATIILEPADEQIEPPKTGGGSDHEFKSSGEAPIYIYIYITIIYICLLKYSYFVDVFSVGEDCSNSQGLFFISFIN